MRRLLMLLTTFLLTVTTFAQQDHYHELIEQLVKQSMPTAETMDKFLEGYVEVQVKKGLSEGEAKQRGKAFFEEKIVPEMVNLFEKHMRQQVTEPQLEEVVKVFSSPEMRSAILRLQNVVTSEGAQNIVKTLQDKIPAVIQGEEVTMPKVDVEENFRQSYMKLVEKTDMPQVVMKTINSTFSSLRSAFPNLQSEEVDRMIGNITRFISNNITEITLSMFKDGWTVDDLDRLNSFYSTPAGEAYLKASSGFTEEFTGRILAMFMEEMK